VRGFVTVGDLSQAIFYLTRMFLQLLTMPHQLAAVALSLGAGLGRQKTLAFGAAKLAINMTSPLLNLAELGLKLFCFGVLVVSEAFNLTLDMAGAFGELTAVGHKLPSFEFFSLSGGHGRSIALLGPALGEENPAEQEGGN
jgi:hypothetical protein